MKDLIEGEILKILQERDYATISDLSKALFLSESSIRRKLTKLQEKSLVVRTHGGVRRAETNNIFPSFTFRSHQNCIEKKKIALTAVNLIHENDVVFLDGTTSVFFVAEYLKQFKNIRVITNGIDTLSVLSKNNIFGYSTGGAISNTNRSVLIGQNAINMINSYHADICFFSAQSITRDGEIYDCFEEENYLRQAMIKNSNKKIFLCDSTKFGKSSPYKLCSLNDIDYIITDKINENYLDEKFSKKIIRS
ncbi:MAG: DeoR/GlpR family DNA-binding transcription regulator [Clostridia bacterium]|nr:DeoR/GlpR family DNA-binding transcription regulator [Clostridia bacterium]